jgi:hypothetical protein
MQIDPKLSFYFGVWTSILLMIASAGVNFFDGALPAAYIPIIVKWCSILGTINSAILTAASGYSSNKFGPMVSAPIAPTAQAVVKVLLVAFALSMFLAGNPAMAQGPRAVRQASAPPVCDPLNLIPGCRPNPNSTAPATDSDRPCDITILTKLTPANLVPTIKKCVSNVNSSLVNDTSRALDSAKAFQPNPDQDAVNCLAPGLALFKAGVQVPAVPEAPAVLNADGSVKTPAVAAVPAQDPGPILLFQKYREFTLAGGLTSCQNWVNTPVNATLAAGAGAGATAIAGAALIAPK